jgi:nucleotide-binding universal stress UspA family protein
MYKKILVPLDGSKRAEAIFPHVEELANCFGAKIIFLEVIEPLKVYATSHGFMPQLELERNKKEILIPKIEAYLANLEGNFREKKIAAQSFIEEGAVVSMIIKVAERESVDLIAMASHGRTGLSHVFYGSIAAGVLHRIDRPLLLIRAEPQ